MRNSDGESTTRELIAAATSAEDPEKEALLEELSRTYEELQLAYDLQGVLEDEIDHRLLFHKILQCLGRLLPIEQAEVWVSDREALQYRCLLRFDGQDISSNAETLPYYPALEPELLKKGVQVIREEHQAMSPVDFFLLRMAHRMGLPTVAAPLLCKASFFGVLLLKIPASMEDLSASKLRWIAAVARQTSLVIHLHLLLHELRESERLREELDIARKIQRNLLPQTAPQGRHFEIYAGCVTAAQVGGDYYDFFPRPEGSLGIVVADTSGHSLASGLMAMSFRSSFRHFLDQGLEPGSLFARVNSALYGELKESDCFLSAVYGTLDDESLRFRYINAGHPPPCILDPRRGQCRVLEESGLLVGILPDEKYEAAEVTLEAGNILVLYTDGITEAENQHGLFFGTERLQEALRRSSKKSARGIYHHLLKEMYVFQDEQFNKDDVTMVVVKVKDRL